MLFKIALKNIQKNSYDYIMYFVSMVFSILIYYTFASIKYNETIETAIDNSTKLSSSFVAATVVLGIFSAMFIWYSNLFFTKKRKKEFGLYSLMGVKKKQIGRMFFYENIVMGVIAIYVGILLGSFFSKFFTMILVRLMGFDVNVEFFFSWKQVIETLIVFLSIFFIVALQGYYIIYRYKLIDLFKSMNIGDKTPKTNNFLAILSVVFILGSYYISHTLFMRDPITGMIATLILAISGTYIFFRYFMQLIVKNVKKNKKYYYKSVNMISTSTLSYRIKSNYKTLATITILSAITLTTIGTAYSFYFLNFENARDLSPMSFIYNYSDERANDKIMNIIEKDNKIEFNENIEIINTEVDFEEFDSTAYMTNFGTKSPHATFINNSNYKVLSNYLGIYEDYNLSDDEAIMVMRYYKEDAFPDYTKDFLITKSNKKISIKKIQAKSLINSDYFYDLFIVNDNTFNDIKKNNTPSSLTMIDVENPTETKRTVEELKNHFNNNLTFDYFYKYYEATLDGRGLFVFISGFLGIVFLIATGTIIFFKQLTEANDDWKKYIILKKIGVSKKELKKTVKKQMLVIFGIPLLFGLIHSLVALDVLAILMQVSLIKPIIISFSVYIFIYLIFYIMTVSSYTKIILSHK